jgi:ribosome-associated protein
MNIINTKLKKIAEILENKKAEDLQMLYVGRQTWITDYFIIVSGTSPIHTKALADSLLEEFKETPVSVDGVKTGKWILMDYMEVIVHIFTSETRAYYNLEKLWAEV